MNVLDKAREAMALVTAGREALAQIAEAVADGTAAVAAADEDEIARILDGELEESRAAHAALRDAIHQSRR